MVTTKAFDEKTGLRISENTVGARLQRAGESILGVITAPFTGPAVQARNPKSIVANAAALVGNNAYVAAAVPATIAVAPAVVGGGSAAGATSMAARLSGAAVAGAVGLGAGLLISGSGGAKTSPQSAQQTGGPIAPTNIQNTTINTTTDQSIRQRYNITGSPGASIYGSATPTSSVSATPSFSAPIDATQGLGQEQTASSSSSSSLLLLALGAAVLLMGSRR